MPDVRALHKFLRSEFDSEAKNGFARLRRVPDTHVRHFLDYYLSLSASEQNDLADGSTLWGALRLLGPRTPENSEALEKNPALQKWWHEMVMCRGRDPHHYYSVPLLRLCVAQAKIDRANGKPSSVPKELEQYAASIRSVKAPELRKLVRPLLRSILNARSSNLGGGDWSYEGVINDSQVMVLVDYGGGSAQLGYEIAVCSAESAVDFKRAGFEVMLGAGHGNWDFIVEENVGDSMILLGEFVNYVAELPKRLPAGCLNGGVMC